jgi:hypothetical protein
LEEEKKKPNDILFYVPNWHKNFKCEESRKFSWGGGFHGKSSLNQEEVTEGKTQNDGILNELDQFREFFAFYDSYYYMR